ncbi:hypothetical protein ACJZ2D_003362 [Fusarium nematophilum]
MGSTESPVQHDGDDTVLVAGGGPAGLMVATVLAHFGIKPMVLERNNSATKDDSYHLAGKAMAPSALTVRSQTQVHESTLDKMGAMQA